MANVTTVCVKISGKERVLRVGQRCITLMDDRGSKPVVDLTEISQEVVDRLLAGDGLVDWAEICRLIQK